MKKEKLNNKYLSCLNTKTRREKKIMNPEFNLLIQAIKHSLPFLDIQDYYQLLSLNKTFEKNLKKPIYKRLLIYQTPQMVSKYRTTLYKQILKANKYSTE